MGCGGEDPQFLKWEHILAGRAFSCCFLSTCHGSYSSRLLRLDICKHKTWCLAATVVLALQAAISVFSEGKATPGRNAWELDLAHGPPAWQPSSIPLCPAERGVGCCASVPRSQFLCKWRRWCLGLEEQARISSWVLGISEGLRLDQVAELPEILREVPNSGSHVILGCPRWQQTLPGALRWLHQRNS